MPHYSKSLHAMLDIPGLSVEEENRLARAAQAGDIKARNRLIEGNLHHAAAFALTYSGYNMDPDDLCAEAVKGLMHAVPKFDTTRGVKFLTYAVNWMRVHVNAFVMKNWTMVRMPCTLRTDVFFRLRREMNEALQRCEGDSDQAIVETAQRIGWTEDKVRDNLNNLVCRDLCLDMPSIRSGDDRHNRVDCFHSRLPLPDEAYEQAFDKDKARLAINRIMKNVNEREREILRLRYLCDPEDVLNLQDISVRWGVSRERVRQVEKALFAKLYAYLKYGHSMKTGSDGKLKRAMQLAPQRAKPTIRYRGRGSNYQPFQVASVGDEAQLAAANA